MTVALVLATATACDLVSKPAIAASPPRATAAGGSSGQSPRDAAAQTGQSVSAPAGMTGSEMAAGLPLPSLHGGHVAMEPLLARLCGQLRVFGISDIYVITPPGRGSALAAMAWEGISNAGAGLARDPALVQVIECASVAAELRAAAAVVRSVSGSGEAILLCTGDIVAHTEALARLNRSLTTTALTAGEGAVRLPADPDLRPALRLAGPGRDASGRGGSSRGAGGEHGRPGRRKVVAAGSAFHRVHAPNAAGCGAVLVSPADQDKLADVADELAVLAGRQTRPGTTREAGQRGGGFTDSSALLLVGLVRSGVSVEALGTGPLTCVRVRNSGQATDAAAKLHAVDEDKIRLDDAVSPDGIIATFFVNPYSRFIARWAARRRLTPDAVTGMSIGLGLLAAVWFSLGSRAGLILGAVLLSGSFVLGSTDGQLARYSRQGNAFRTWLDRFSGRVVEYAVYAGLAAGAASVAGPGGPAASGWIAVLQRPSVWQLAIATAMLQSVRDMIGFSASGRVRRAAGSAWPPPLPLDEPADYAVPSRVIAGRDGSSAPPRGRLAVWMRTQARRVRRFGRGVMTWTARIVEFGPGERVAVICVAVVAAGARIAFLVLLGWGLVSVCLTTIGQLMRSFARAVPDAADHAAGGGDDTRGAYGGPNAAGLVAYRDDGFIARLFGRFVEGQLPPLLPAVAGVTVVTILSVVGASGFAGALVLAPVAAMALAGLGSANPHDGRLDWLVPPALQFGQFVFLAALALAGHVPSPVTFSLVAVIALHYYDIVYRALPAVTGENAVGAAEGFTAVPGAPEWLSRAGLGWDGRMLVAGLGAMLGANTATFALLSVYLWLLFGWESLSGWIGVLRSDRAARGSRSHVISPRLQ